ncbi:hypothetical protein VM1G_01883 [Cytospora mali]|uniref:Uncharacterized protein n=1 Tax=Cytospora mali TaxID=578113 RepID=A0A194VPP9_CYTMA|nr:hypothetical protein VM1G_01883 [Valsa mali]
MASYARIPPPKKEAVGSISNIVAKLDKTVKRRFDRAFDEWKATWFNNTLERDTKYKVDSGDIANFKVLQRPANLIVDANYKQDPEEQSAMIIDLNHERTLKFDRLVTAWVEQQRAHIGANNLSAYTVDCDAYWELVDLGPSIIANAMIEYAAEQDDWWHELLHEIVHGERGGGTFFKPQLYEA